MIRIRDKKITVLQVATLNRPIKPNNGYGPIESVILNIDKGLHLLGHRSIVACSGDSIVTGEQHVTEEKSFSEYWSEDTTLQRKRMKNHLMKALERAHRGDIDIVHLHDVAMVKYIYERSLKSPVPIVMTLHVPAIDSLPFKQWSDTLAPSAEVYFIPISEYQKNENHGLGNLMNVVHHGIDLDNYPSKKEANKESYLFTIARITQVKGQHIAIAVAKKTGSKLIIAGNIQNKREDREYFEGLKGSIDLCVDAGKHPANETYYAQVIKPLMDNENKIIYIGEIDREQKKLWYLHARATLFPIQWGEPFGLVMIESMACGTSIIAFNKGSVPEIVKDGKTGFIVNSLEEMIRAVNQINAIDPAECRRHVQDNFSMINMAKNYLARYFLILNKSITMNYAAVRAAQKHISKKEKYA